MTDANTGSLGPGPLRRVADHFARAGKSWSRDVAGAVWRRLDHIRFSEEVSKMSIEPTCSTEE